MLNANAKAFIPGGSQVGATAAPSVSSPQESPLYRYSISIPTSRSAETVSAVTLSSLLIKRQISGVVKGGASLALTQQFVAEFFSALSNSPVSPPSVVPCGFMLSRELLSLQNMDAVNEANERDGFLLPLTDISGVAGVEVGSSIAPIWETFMQQFGQDFRVTLFGYIYFHTNDAKYSDGKFHHFIFACTTPKKSQLVQLQAASFASISKKATHHRRLMPYVLSPSLTFGLIIDLSRTTISGLKQFRINFSESCEETLKSIAQFEEDLATYIVNTARESTEFLTLEMLNLDRNEIPFVDVLNIVCQACEALAGGVVGIVASSSDWAGSLSRGLREEWHFDGGETLQSIINRKVIASTGSHFKAHIRIPAGTFASTLSSDDYQSLLKELPKEGFNSFGEGPWLTRCVLVANIDAMAKESFKVRRRIIGVPVLIVVDSNGKVFCVDLVERNAVVVSPGSWSNALAAPHNCVFRGTLTTSFRGDKQHRIVLHDVLKFAGDDHTCSTFTQRWSAIDVLGLDDESCWPHGSPSGVVILKSVYVQLGQAEQLLNDNHIDHPSSGLQLVCLSKQCGDSTMNYRWSQPETLTARFIADEIETMGAVEGQPVKRAYLSCRSNGGHSIYHDEYVDYHEHSVATLSEGSVVECMLRRNGTDSTTHWWDLLRDFSRDEFVRADSEADVEALVCSPILMLEELRWMMNATTFLCTRCSSVNDLGKQSAEMKGYLCRPCWEATGHGDCVGCATTYVSGSKDTISGRFYCDNCWLVFTTPRSLPIGAPPPPPDASFSKQVSTRVISLFIDRIGSKGPNNDVLELCCGGSVVRKWINAGATTYVGVDIDDTAVEDCATTIKMNCQSAPSSPTGTSPRSMQHEVIKADAFAVHTWTNLLARAHPAQFHTITCFGGLHHAFETEEAVRSVLFSISNALVPNGIFMGSLVSANALFRKGRNYANSVFRCSWSDDASPRVGAQYNLQLLAEDCDCDQYVVPLDFLVAIAGEYNLLLLREFTFTFADLLADDEKWTRPLTADEKELLSIRMTFAFRKSFQKGGPTTPTSPGASAN